MNPTVKINRRILESFLPNQQAVKAFEALFEIVEKNPTNENDDVLLSAYAAISQLSEQLSGLAAILDSVLASVNFQNEKSEDFYSPPNLDKNQADQYRLPFDFQGLQDVYIPPIPCGNMADQNSSSVSIKGGSIDGVAIGQSDPKEGNFARVYVNAVQVVGPRALGYSAMTGTADRSTAYSSSSVTLQQLAERVKALQDDLIQHGLIG